MVSINRYLTNEWPFPSTDIDPKEKAKPEYGIKWCAAIYSLWLRNSTSWGYDTVEYFNKMRKYSEGSQDNSQYKAFLKVQEPSTTENLSIWDDNDLTRQLKRSGYGGIMWQNLSPAPKILNSLHGLMDKMDYDVMADTIDSDSRGLIEFMKYKQFHEAKDAEFQMEFKKKAGLPVDQPTNFPKTKEELESFEAREGFKLNVAKSMQKLLRFSFYDSRWDNVVRKKVVDDLVCTKYATTLDYFDDETQTFKVMWIDPAKTVLQFSHEFDYSDSEWGGYFDLWTISNIRRKCPDLSEDQLFQLAKNYKGRFGNPNRWYERYSHIDPATRGYGFDDWKVCVFRAFWIDSDTHRSIYWKGKNNPRIIDISYDSVVKPLTESQRARGFQQEVRNTQVRQVYQCHWVLDSEIAFDYGKYQMAARPEMTKPQLPIHAEQLLQPSIVYRLVPILDHIAIAWLQFWNDLANMVQRGYAINMSMLMNVAMDGKDLGPLEIIDMWKRKGLLMYMPGPQGTYTGGMPTPVTPIEGGLGPRVEETMTVLQGYYKAIEDIVGLNPLALGATPDPNAPVSTSEAALKATSNVLKPINDALFEVKQSIAESLAMRIQIGLRVSDTIRKAYAGVVNPTDIRTMIMAEQNNVKYGIMLRVRPNDAQRQSVMRYMEIAIQSGQITPTDAMYFSERIEQGEDITEIRQEIAYSIQKNLEQQQQAQQANIDRQNQGLAQIEQQKAQSAQQQTVLDTQGKMAEENERAKSKAMLERMTQNYKLLADTQARADAERGLQVNVNKQ
jgi:hypothetical protein